MKFFDGQYYVEDVAAARISNFLSHNGLTLADDQRKMVARIIVGAMVGYIIQNEGCYQEFIEPRRDKWGL